MQREEISPAISLQGETMLYHGVTMQIPFQERRCLMKTLSILSALCLFSLHLIEPLEGTAQVQPLQFRLASSILGSSVKNPQGKDLGSIKDLVVSPGDNRVVYAVLSFGGVLGLGEKVFAVPLSALKPAAEAKTFVLEIIQSSCRQRPSSTKIIGRR
jgi:sporulation protein YlmC with PRC-barrel domain